MSLGCGAVVVEARPTARPHVLVVDDDDAVRRAVERMLTTAGFRVTSVEGGREAAAILGRMPFDAVLTDIMMPGMSAMEVLRVARCAALELPVLLMTGAPDVKSAADAVQYGACDYIFKPVRPADLARAMRRAVAMSRLGKARREALNLLGGAQPGAGDRVGLEVTFERALESMWMAYQPIVSAATTELVGFEALLRSDEPALPNPGAVFEAAERLGRLTERGRKIRSKVPEPMGRTAPETLLFVNLHARDLEDFALVSPDTPLSAIAHRVVLEITERASLDGEIL